MNSSAADDLALVFTIPEAAKLLRISRGSAYEAAKRGEIPTIRIGHRLLVPRSQLEKLLIGLPGNDQASLRNG